MSVTSGFFNSVNHDRRYDARQFSKLFDGVINDGVFANIGDCLAVSENSGNIINVAPGKCWFNSVFVENDAILPLTAEESEILLDRYDAVVVEIDDSITVRKGDIKVIKGTPASTPQYPTMASTETLHQYPLAYIYRKAGSVAITQADITNMVGMEECPYITGILEVHNIDHIVAQWEAQWKAWMSQWAGWEGEWNEWLDNTTTDASNDIGSFIADSSADFERWYRELQAVLEPDVATNLAAKVVELQERFRLLAEEGCVCESLEDSNSDEFTDSYGGVILGTTSLNDCDGSHSNSEIVTPIPVYEKHASKHSSDGIDPIDPIDIGAVPITGIQMEGSLIAKSDLNPTIPQVRNMYYGTDEMEVGSTPLESGVIYLMYE